MRDGNTCREKDKENIIITNLNMNHKYDHSERTMHGGLDQVCVHLEGKNSETQS